MPQVAGSIRSVRPFVLPPPGARDFLTAFAALRGLTIDAAILELARAAGLRLVETPPKAEA
jgi:hypothetical protein